MKDQRRLQRFSVNAPVEILAQRGGRKRRIPARTRDVSASGAYVYVDDPEVVVGDRVAVMIQLPAGGMGAAAESAEAFVSGIGTVVRHDFGGVAVAFARSLRFSSQPNRP